MGDVSESKPDSKVPSRLSISQRPSTAQLVDEIHSATGLSKTDIYTAGADVLHFVWSALGSGATLGIKMNGETEFSPVAILVPGMITPQL